MYLLTWRDTPWIFALDTEVEDAGVPVGVDALARISMLEEMGPVEEPDPVLIVREMRRDPVQNDPNPGLVKAVDQVHEVLRRPVAAARSEVARGLIAPRAVEGMLHQGKKLDVREAQSAQVLGQGMFMARILVAVQKGDRRGPHALFMKRA